MNFHHRRMRHWLPWQNSSNTPPISAPTSDSPNYKSATENAPLPAPPTPVYHRLTCMARIRVEASSAQALFRWAAILRPVLPSSAPYALAEFLLHRHRKLVFSLFCQCRIRSLRLTWLLTVRNFSKNACG